MKRLIARAVLTIVTLAACYGTSWAQASNVIFPTNYPYTQTNLRAMDIIKSRNGVLEATVKMYSAGTNSDPMKYGMVDAYSGTGSSNVTSDGTNAGMYGFAYQWSAYGSNYQKGFPGTMLQIQPGETLKVTQINYMGTNFDTNDAVFNTSFHYHGSHAPDLSTGDNVYILDAPLSVNLVNFPILKYLNSVGLNWYHTHPDLYTKDQVQGGLAGLIMVGDPLDAFPAYKGKFKQVNMAFSEVNLQTNASGKFQFFQLQTGNASGTNYTRGWQKMINGQMNPIITIAPGETQIWNWAWVGARGALMPVIADANLSNAWSNCTILARDGNSAFVRPITGALGAYLPSTNSGTNSTNYYTPRLQDLNSQSLLATGGRTSWAITAPTNPGTYYLMDAFGGEEDPNNSNENQFFYVLATINVTGTTVTGPPVYFAPQPADFLWVAKPNVYRTFGLEQQFFSTVNPQYLDSIDNFFIDGLKFGEGVLPQLEMGTVEEWTIVNGGGLNHPFHIHQGNFIVTQVSGVMIDPKLPTYPDFAGRNYVSPMDVAFVPAYGSITIRFAVPPFPGKYVWHCHILEHEDEGMMSPVFQFPGREGIRLGLGASLPSLPVINGLGNVTNIITPFPGYVGPIVAASGVGTSTNTNGISMPKPLPATPSQVESFYNKTTVFETMAVGTRARSALVKIYNNGSNAPSAQFTAFTGKLGASGVSLAVGGISTNGVPIIAVGSRAPGPATVSLWNQNGRAIRTLTNILPGNCPSGVNVAIGDVNADNFDDLIVSAGAGREAIVTAISGRDISYGVPVPKKLFTTVLSAPASKEGAKVAVGYVAPSTTASYYPNLVTTPEAGLDAGTVSVWNINNFYSDGMGGMGGMSSGSANKPTLMTAYQPFGRGSGVVNIATTYQTLPNGKSQPVIAAWQKPYAAAFTGIGINNNPLTQLRQFSPKKK
ncbi:MAG: multicopper oxidase domain-containing protein [Chthoniobacterales bacterium]